MGRTTCPSCGAGFHGKRCRRCGYEHFSEETAHRSHASKGEPLAVDPPVRTPMPGKARRKHPLIRFLILLYLIYCLMPIFRQWGLKLEAMENSRSPQPGSSYQSQEVPHG